MQRRTLLTATSLLVAQGLLTRSGHADEEVAVPVPLQMELLLKVASYDKNLGARAPDRVRVLLLAKPNSASGNHVAQLAGRLLSGKALGGRAVEASAQPFGDAAGLAQRIKAQRVAIVYLAPGFDAGELAAIAKALSGLSVLSVGALSRFVQSGTVLGFDLVSGKPKLVIHQKRARDQGVEFSSQVLKLAKVIE
jgi:hypothetical protein